MKKIVIIGSTGMLGKPVTEEIIRTGFEVTLAVRNVKKAAKHFPSSKLVQADVLDKESLLKVFKNQEMLYVSLQAERNCKPSDQLPENEGIDNIISAAKDSGIQRIAYLSSLIMNYNGMNGFRWWIFSIKQSAVERIKNCGIPYTIFYPSSFMENLDQLMLQGNRIMLAGKSKAPMWFIAGEDYAKQVASSFRKLTTENREYPVQGLEAYTWDDAAKIFIDNYSKANLKVFKAPLKLFDLLGNFNRKINYGYKIFEALNNYPEKFESHQTWEELGKPVITLKEYARKLSM